MCVTHRVRPGLRVDSVLASVHTSRSQTRTWRTVQVRKEAAETPSDPRKPGRPQNSGAMSGRRGSSTEFLSRVLCPLKPVLCCSFPECLCMLSPPSTWRASFRWRLFLTIVLVPGWSLFFSGWSCAHIAVWQGLPCRNVPTGWEPGKGHLGYTQDGELLEAP